MLAGRWGQVGAAALLPGSAALPPPGPARPRRHRPGEGGERPAEQRERRERRRARGPPGATCASAAGPGGGREALPAWTLTVGLRLCRSGARRRRRRRWDEGRIPRAPPEEGAARRPGTVRGGATLPACCSHGHRPAAPVCARLPAPSRAGAGRERGCSAAPAGRAWPRAALAVSRVVQGSRESRALRWGFSGRAAVLLYSSHHLAAR